MHSADRHQPTESTHEEELMSFISLTDSHNTASDQRNETDQKTGEPDLQMDPPSPTMTQERQSTNVNYPMSTESTSHTPTEPERPSSPTQEHDSEIHSDPFDDTNPPPGSPPKVSYTEHNPQADIGTSMDPQTLVPPVSSPESFPSQSNEHGAASTHTSQEIEAAHVQLLAVDAPSKSHRTMTQKPESEDDSDHEISFWRRNAEDRDKPRRKQCRG